MAFFFRSQCFWNKFIFTNHSQKRFCTLSYLLKNEIAFFKYTHKTAFYRSSYSSLVTSIGRNKSAARRLMFFLRTTKFKENFESRTEHNQTKQSLAVHLQLNARYKMSISKLTDFFSIYFSQSKPSNSWLLNFVIGFDF